MLLFPSPGSLVLTLSSALYVKSNMKIFDDIIYNNPRTKARSDYLEAFKTNNARTIKYANSVLQAHL